MDSAIYLLNNRGLLDKTNCFFKGFETDWLMCKSSYRDASSYVSFFRRKQNLLNIESKSSLSSKMDNNSAFSDLDWSNFH